MDAFYFTMTILAVFVLAFGSAMTESLFEHATRRAATLKLPATPLLLVFSIVAAAGALALAALLIAMLASPARFLVLGAAAGVPLGRRAAFRLLPG